jgi:hypothetical protein
VYVFPFTWFDLTDEKVMLYDLAISVNTTGTEVNALLGQSKGTLVEMSAMIDTIDLSSISNSIDSIDVEKVSTSINNVQNGLQDLQRDLIIVSAQLRQFRSYAEIGILLTIVLCLIIVMISVVLILTLRVVNKGFFPSQMNEVKEPYRAEPFPEETRKNWKER